MPPDPSTAFEAQAERALRERFDAAAAQGVAGRFAYPTGVDGLRALDYPQSALAALPPEVLAWYCGVGNVFAPGAPAPGASVLDIGCGAGVDALLAAGFAGAAGRVAGVELSASMLLRAKENAFLAGARNVVFACGRADRLPFADASFDLVITNGVYNLVQDKARALAEAFRVLKPGGMLHVADQVSDSDAASCPLPPAAALSDPAERARAWAC